MSYNPSATATIGLEFDAYTDGVTSLSSPTVCAAFWVDSSATETIDEIYIPHTWTGPSTGYGKLCVDVYDLAGTGAGATLTETRYQPNEDDAESNVYNDAWSAVTAGTTYVRIDEVSYSDSDYLNFPNSSSVRMAFNTGAMSSSLQVASVKFEIRAFGYWGATGQMRVELYNNTTRVSTLATITPPADSDGTHPGFRTYTVGPFTTNPLTGAAWTATDIINMDTGANLMVQLQCDEGRGMVAVSWLSMIVTTGADVRVATGTTATQTSLPSGIQTNLPVTLAANWSKASGTDYLLVCRRIDDPTGSATTLIPQPMWIGTGTNPHVHGQSYSSTLAASGLLATTGSVDTTKTYGFWLARTDNAMSADSQPYYDVVLQKCHTSSTLKQGVNGAAATTYKGVQLLVASPTTTPGADLLVKVKRVSDNVQLGGTATITAASITSGTLLGTLSDSTLGNVSIYRLNVNLASTATLAAVDYYFEYTSTAASTAPWYVVMLDGDADHALTGNTTYGGTTNNATIAGVDDEEADFVTRISTTMTTPSSITVTGTSTAINGATFYYSDVDWVDGGAIGATFERWEVDRSEDGGTTYATIAYVETEATITFADYEAPRATTLKYRVRKVRTDGAVSDYVTQSDTTSLTATASGLYVFTSNSAPSLSVGYAVLGTEARYGFLNANETVFHRLHDRDYQAAFRPLENRGLSWSFDLIVHASKTAPSAGRGVQAFGALLALAESDDVSYICLHTADSERFFGTIQVSGGRRVEPNGAYIASVTFTETQADSSMVTV